MKEKEISIHKQDPTWHSLALCSSENAISIIPLKFAKAHNILPISVLKTNPEETLIIGRSVNSNEIEIRESLKLITDKNIILREIPEHDLSKAISFAYQKFRLNSQVSSLKINEELQTTKKRKFISLEEENNSLAPTLLQNILLDAISKKASDIHLDNSSENYANINFRIDGELCEQHKYQMSNTSYKKLLRHILVLCELDITKVDHPQEGMFEMQLDSITIRLRISCLPTVNGNKLAIRLLYHPMLDEHSNSEQNLLETLNIPPRYQTLYRSLIHKKGGLILLSGPTGSGKSTLLYSLIQIALKNKSRNVMTIEDPVERKVIGATQIEINERNSLSYDNILKKLLRQDPDVVVLSEIRDSETALTALESSLSGILILSTIHATNVPELILRLLELSCPPLTIASTIKLISSQRLLRKLCRYCKTPHNRESLTKEKLRINAGTPLYISPGCNKCYNTGVSGRIAVYEFCEPTYDLISTLSTLFKDGLNSSNNQDLETALRNSRYLSFANSLRNLLIEGIISEDEAESILF